MAKKVQMNHASLLEMNQLFQSLGEGDLTGIQNNTDLSGTCEEFSKLLNQNPESNQSVEAPKQSQTEEGKKVEALKKSRKTANPQPSKNALTSWFKSTSKPSEKTEITIQKVQNAGDPEALTKPIPTSSLTLSLPKEAAQHHASIPTLEQESEYLSNKLMESRKPLITVTRKKPPKDEPNTPNEKEVLIPPTKADQSPQIPTLVREAQRKSEGLADDDSQDESPQQAEQQRLEVQRKAIATMKNSVEGRKLSAIFSGKGKGSDEPKTQKSSGSDFFNPNLPPYEAPVIKLQFEDPLLLNPTYAEDTVTGTLGPSSTGPSSMTIISNPCLQINTTYLQRYLRAHGDSEMMEGQDPAAGNQEKKSGPLAGLEHLQAAIMPKKHLTLKFDEEDAEGATSQAKEPEISMMDSEIIEERPEEMQDIGLQDPKLGVKSKPPPRRETIQLDPERLKTSKRIMLGDTELLFPYEPYKEQMQYMEHLVGCLDTAHNGLFESPTGTGKTLSLLVGTLGWLKKQIDMGKNTQAKIFYASRTHSQLKQLVDELKSTAYIPNISVMGSRDQLCINKELSESEGGERNARCFRLINGEYCQYYRNITTHRSKYLEAYGDKLLDIEEMHFVGKSNSFCPFYFSRSLIKNAHIVFLPYSYLTFTEFRVLLREYLNNSVIIIDEAHNISQSAEDGASIKITSKDTQMITRDIDAIIKAVRITIATTATNANLGGKARKAKEGEEPEEDEPMTKEKQLEEEIIVKAIRFLETIVKKAESLKAPIDRFRSIMNARYADEKGASGTLEAWEIFKMFHDAVTGGTIEKCFKESPQDWRREMVRNINEIFDVLDHVTQNKKLNFLNTNNLMKWSLTLVRVIELYWNFRRYEKVGKSWKKQMISHYTIVLEDKTKSDGKPNVMMILKCLTPSLAFRDIQEEHPRSIVFTSGTLSPMELYSTEFEIPFEHTFRCGHVINPERQLFAAVVKHVAPNIKVNFSFDHRHDINMKKTLGRRLVELSHATPKGMLLFFTSYAMMDNYYEFWKGEGIIGELEVHKVVCKEPSQAHLIQAEFMRFSVGIHQKAGALFFAVCGGKLSEGIDFTDEMARTVVLMGVPYPNTQDVHVKSKKLYLDRFKQQEEWFEIETKTGIIRKNRMSGHDWYNYQAIRLVNQAIGRVIRHKYDFGAVLLLDARFGVRQNLEEISKWVSNQIQKIEQFSGILEVKNLPVSSSSTPKTQTEPTNKTTLEEFFQSAQEYTALALKSAGTGGKKKKEERIEFLIRRRDQIMKVGSILTNKFLLKAKQDKLKKAQKKKLKQQMEGRNASNSIAVNELGDSGDDDSDSDTIQNPWSGEIEGIHIQNVEDISGHQIFEIDCSDGETKRWKGSGKSKKAGSKQPKKKKETPGGHAELGKRVQVEDIDEPEIQAPISKAKPIKSNPVVGERPHLGRGQAEERGKPANNSKGSAVICLDLDSGPSTKKPAANKPQLPPVKRQLTPIPPKPPTQRPPKTIDIL